VQPSEVIIVDDGSEKTESELVESLATQYGFKYIRKSNGGQSSARNLGVISSSSQYICFLDQDDFFLPHHIEVLVDAIKNSLKYNVAYAYGDLSRADAKGDILELNFTRKHTTHPKTSVFKCLTQDMFILPSASLISRESFDSIGGFDENLIGYEDDDLFLRLFLAGYQGEFVPEDVAVWCIRSDSTSYSLHMAVSRLNFFKKWVDIIEKLDLSRDEEMQLFCALVRRFTAPFLISAAKEVGIQPPPGEYAFRKLMLDFIKIVIKNKLTNPKIRFQLMLVRFMFVVSPKVLAMLVNLRVSKNPHQRQ